MLRAQLTKLRVSAHSLAIETGRYKRPYLPASERFCKCCSVEIEDETHFLLYCPLYRELREKYNILSQIPKGQNDFYIITKVINPETYDQVKKLCMYIKDAMEVRHNFINT